MANKMADNNHVCNECSMLEIMQIDPERTKQDVNPCPYFNRIFNNNKPLIWRDEYCEDNQNNRVYIDMDGKARIITKDNGAGYDVTFCDMIEAIRKAREMKEDN